MNSFMEKFAFLRRFLELPGDDQTTIELQLKGFYPQKLLTISQFIGDKDFDTTFFLWIGYSFAQEAKKSSKLFKKTLDSLNASTQNIRPKIDDIPQATPRSQTATYPSQLLAQNGMAQPCDPKRKDASGVNSSSTKQRSSQQNNNAPDDHVIYPIPMSTDSDTDFYNSESSMDVDQHVISMPTKKKNKKSLKKRAGVTPSPHRLTTPMDTSENLHFSDSESVIDNEKVRRTPADKTSQPSIPMEDVKFHTAESLAKKDDERHEKLYKHPHADRTPNAPPVIPLPSTAPTFNKDEGPKVSARRDTKPKITKSPTETQTEPRNSSSTVVSAGSQHTEDSVIDS